MFLILPLLANCKKEIPQFHKLVNSYSMQKVCIIQHHYFSLMQLKRDHYVMKTSALRNENECIT